MTKTILLLLLGTFLFSCSSSKKSTSTTGIASEATASQVISGDGSSYEKAVVINEKTETTGVDAEYKWLKENYPGYKMMSQSLSNHGSRVYDILKITTADGEKKDVYFDITNFFGKF